MLHPKCILKKICYEHFGKFTEQKLQCRVPFIQFPDEITATLHNLNCIANVFLIIIQNFHNSCFPEHLRMTKNDYKYDQSHESMSRLLSNNFLIIKLLQKDLRSEGWLNQDVYVY